MSFATGALVRARGREWVVLPESQGALLRLRPLGGGDDEVTAVHTALEAVEPARFGLPRPTEAGDHRSGRLLREAVKLASRSAAGPFRSFARIAVEPRPYQLVPLLMALRQNPVRLLIADDVGIGKTVEALLIARELLDRGEITRLCVLCPPHLAAQWQAELREKFHIEAERVLADTVNRLERGLRLGETVFERYPFTVVSTDFVKSDRRREDFLRTAPELVIVDEAHTCAYSGEARGGQHQRHLLLSRLSQDPRRHLVLVTATPHSGHEQAFRSLLTLLNPDFRHLPEDLSGERNEPYRRKLAQHLVQRKRADIREYLDAETPFPERFEPKTQPSYALTPEYLALLDKVLAYAREVVAAPGENTRHQRVRWWAALGLMRSVASSPAAAALALRNRAAPAEAATEAEVDEMGRRTVLDLDDAEGEIEMTPGAETEAAGSERRLRALATQAEALKGERDPKLHQATALVRDLLDEGHQPIVFCRFIETAQYVAEHLRNRLGGATVEAVTGLLAPAEREARVAALAQAERRVLVATDCLSEGINLQHSFSAVLHYDLAWNPTRHEQREGRVDRYGQPSPTVKVITLFGHNNPVDGIVLEVLIEKHKTIRNRLGISVPVPVETDQVIQAVMAGLLIRDSRHAQQPGLFAPLDTQKLHLSWESVAERERRSRSLFAQHSISVEEVRHELQAAQQAVGEGVALRRFLKEGLELFGATFSERQGVVEANLRESPRGLRDLVGLERFRGRFELPVQEGELYLSRTHPLVEGLATYLLDTALDAETPSPAKRVGVIRTGGVNRVTTLLLLRLRHQLTAQSTLAGRESWQSLAEEVFPAAFSGPPANPLWLSEEEAAQLASLDPDGNVTPEQARDFLGRVLGGLDGLTPYLENLAQERAGLLLEAHQRVREAADLRLRYRAEALLPVDVLGVYLYLPRSS